jgi:antitoxin (DNA-binding transcriptional repressor) of toxin-antitoxin stability system
MRVVKIAAAKKQRSKHLAYVRRGDRVRIVDRTTPVADLVPIVLAADDDEGLVADMIRRGVARAPSGGGIPRSMVRDPPRSARRRGSVVKALVDERRHGR